MLSRVSLETASSEQITYSVKNLKYVQSLLGRRRKFTQVRQVLQKDLRSYRMGHRSVVAKLRSYVFDRRGESSNACSMLASLI